MLHVPWGSSVFAAACLATLGCCVGRVAATADNAASVGALHTNHARPESGGACLPHFDRLVLLYRRTPACLAVPLPGIFARIVHAKLALDSLKWTAIQWRLAACLRSPLAF